MHLTKYITGWLNQRKKNTANIYLVAGQGGGSRAGFWTSAILSRLDELSKDDYNTSFYNNCLALSTVSGSSVGASLFLNAKKARIQDKLHVDSTIVSTNDLEKFFSKDYFSSSVFRLFYLNPIQKIVPVPIMDKNRNERLIKEESQAFDKFFDKKLKRNIYNSDFNIVWDTTKKFNHPLLIPNTYNIFSSS